MIWTRRQFIARTSGGIALAATPLWSSPWSTPKVRAAIVGLGRRGTRHIAAGLLPGVELARVCDIDPAAVDAARRCSERWLGHRAQGSLALDDVLGDGGVDLVVVAAPERERAAIALAALDAGKHVYCEPPWSLDSVEGARLLDRAARSERLLWQGSRETAWQTAVVDEFLRAATDERARVAVRRSAALAESGAWPLTWLDALSSLTPRLPDVSGTLSAINAATPFGRRADVVFTLAGGAQLTLSETPAFQPTLEAQWTLTVASGARTSDLWIALVSDAGGTPEPARDLASWQPFLSALARRDPAEWRRLAADRQRANAWLRRVRAAA